jgi:tRNA pseudouridine38-40 synthase
MKHIEINRNKEFIYIDLKANAFLLHMVRVIVGTLIMVGKKEIQPLDVRNILELKDRKEAGKTVNASGLYFVGPEYPRSFGLPKPKITIL